ncbi:hypothetical protein GQ43DRAFT_112995 [Delitschia confertaspora ATCC 74209]|uniref:Uncharacterized protein n=1 Tax=Delitschia confertaspora ATCC 74209 TaxID=1513339 RepID=A0A9P4JJR1_9PLEO|nr:hypothetical protein GQ43DRAFT_112995 [Delitschia confertaspora ATCC 74209]
MSMGWADNVLVAMGPLGILTLVVSAIRVGGVRRLKGLVGRARESQATAEQELLSSTSSSVCELWSGKEIVRQLGQPDTKELIVVAYEGKFVQVLDLEGAVRGGWLHENVGPDQRATLPELRTIDSQAPNIALNIEGSTATKNELWMWAGIGVLLQSVALVVPALATYYWKFRKASASVPRYAYPCFLIGASVVTIGALLCSHVIEGITEERIFEPSGDSDHPPGEILYVVRLQKACTVSDQSFRPFLIYNQLGNKSIRTSRMKTTEDPQFSLLTVAGFICQFVGLRGLHWSATILQLGVTLIMTAARSWVRRGLAVNPPCIELTPGNELIWASILLSQGILPINGGQKDVSGLLAHTTTSDLKTTSALVRSQIWEFMTGGFHKNYPGFDLHDPEQENKPLVSWPPKPQEPIDATLYPGDQLLEILSHLQQIMPEQNTLLRITSNISRAMEQTISLLNRHVFDRVLTNTGLWEEFTWRHWILHNELQHETAPSLSQISFSIFYETDGRVQIPREKMYSAIRLWMASLETRPEFSNKIEHSSDARHSFTYMRFLGPCRDYSKATFEALPRWIGKKIILCPKPDGRKGFLTNNEVDYLHAQAWPVFGTSVVSG